MSGGAGSTAGLAPNANAVFQFIFHGGISLACVYGHEVGRATALRLCASGVAACFLEGGIDAWKNAGLPLSAKGG